MTAPYFVAAIPEPFRILGLQLKPLSLGRYRLMHRFDCAFVADEDRTAGIADLLLGVLICSMRCDEFLTFLGSKGFSRQMRQWSKRVCPVGFFSWIPFVRKWSGRRNRFNILEKILLFKKYIEEHSKVPKYWDLSDNCEGSGAHWAQGMEVTLRGEVGWSKEEIDEQPLSKGISDYFKYLENQGAIRLMTAYDLELIEAMEKGEMENGTRA